MFNVRESLIEKKVCEYARLNGIKPYKFASPGNRGVPDRQFLVKGGKTFFIEFKAPGKKPTKLQEKEISEIESYGFEVYIIDNVAEGKEVIDSNK